MKDQSTKATPEQLLYANILEKGMFFGLGSMIVFFILYVFGIMKPAVPLNNVAGMWGQPVGKYLAAVNANFLHQPHVVTGWGWARFLGSSDFLNFLPIAVLSGVTILCYICIVPGLLKRGDKAMGIIAIAEAVILTLAASGLLATGGH